MGIMFSQNVIGSLVKMSFCPQFWDFENEFFFEFWEFRLAIFPMYFAVNFFRFTAVDVNASQKENWQN